MQALVTAPRPARRKPAQVTATYETGRVITDIRHYHLKSARVLDGFRLCLRFKDDFMAELNFAKWIRSSKRGIMSRPLADEHYFHQVYLDHGVLTWPNGFDLHPGTVRHWAEQGYCD